MDLVRSCYTTFMRFYRDSPLEIKVRWFFCDEEAGVFPEHHLFGSGNWASQRFNWDGPGEVLDAPRVWDRGVPPDGLIGDHYCGPLVSYTEGTEFPGVPLDALPDGRCACCIPLPPVCADFVADLPATLRLRILDIYDVTPGFPSLYVIGQEFDLVEVVPSPAPPARLWHCSTPIFRNVCPVPGTFDFACALVGDDTVPALRFVGNSINQAPDLVEPFPFRAFYSFVGISSIFCSDSGFGFEAWDVLLYDPAFPP